MNAKQLLDRATKAAAAFNATYPIGTTVRYWKGTKDGNPTGEGVTTHEATVLGGHTAVAWIRGCSGCVALTHVEVVA